RDRAFSLPASGTLGIEPAGTVRVGDSLARDMAGARAAGMAHIWLSPHPARRGAPCCQEDRVIRSLREGGGLLRGRGGRCSQAASSPPARVVARGRPAGGGPSPLHPA